MPFLLVFPERGVERPAAHPTPRFSDALARLPLPLLLELPLREQLATLQGEFIEAVRERNEYSQAPPEESSNDSILPLQSPQ
jgi:hypothetical protein